MTTTTRDDATLDAAIAERLSRNVPTSHYTLAHNLGEQPWRVSLALSRLQQRGIAEPTPTGAEWRRA